MATTTISGPLRVFGRHGDAEHVARRIARSITGARVDKVRRSLVVTVGAGKGLFRQQPSLVVEVDAAAFDAGRPDARQSVRDDIVRSIRGPGLDQVLAMIPDLRIGISFAPASAGRLRTTDPLAHLALDVAAWTDGFVLDLHNGRLVSVAGELLGSTNQFHEEGGTPVDPSAARVRGRLIALLAIAARALTEYDGRDMEEARDAISRWVRSVGMSAELEPHEQAFLTRPAGELDDAELVYGSWQVEGAAVLAWALELLEELPDYDQAVDPAYVSGLLCFPDATKTQAVLALGKRRLQASVEAEAERHHIILRQLQDLAAASEAAAADLDVAVSITTERLRACRWLMAGGTYSTIGLSP